MSSSQFPPLTPQWGGTAGGHATLIGNGPDYMTGWDLCVLAGNPLPGICEVSGPGLMLKKDANKAAGKNGGRPVYHGLEEQRVKIKNIVWTQSQLDILWALRGELLPIPGQQPKNVTIDSPYLYLIGCTAGAIIGGTPLAPHSSSRVGHGLEMVWTFDQWLGGEKAAGKNATVQPKRSVQTTRPLTSKAPPPVTAGAVGPPNFQPA